MLGPLFALAAAVALAQDPQGPPPGPPPQQGEALRVFLDCSYECDVDFIHTEVTFVNWVRDRFDGQVLVLVTTQTTGSHGTDYTLSFIGQKEFVGRADTLHYIAQSDATDDETRHGMARILRLGLVHFTIHTPLAAHLDVRFAPPVGPGAPGMPGGPRGPGEPGGTLREQRDRWNRWVFSTSLNSYFNGQESTSDHSFSGSFSANRITENRKIELSLSGSDYRSRYSYETAAAFDSTYQVSPGHDTTVTVPAVDTTIHSRRQSWSGSARIVQALGPRWSAGVQATVSGSTSQNTDLRAALMPAIEYDLFPYTEATRRQLRLNYSFGVETARYRDTTIFFRTSETYLKHELDAALSRREPWGSVSVSLSATQYWNDARNPNVDVYGSVSVRVMRGLSVNAYGQYSFVRSQRYLAAAGATPDEVLLQLRQLRTHYQYYVSFGFSYTFGSVYNNVVNPRFGSSGGGGMVCYSM
jgi:hypothetical protein